MTNDEIESKLARDGGILRDILLDLFATSYPGEDMRYTLLLARSKAGHEETLCTITTTFGLDESIEALRVLKERQQKPQEG